MVEKASLRDTGLVRDVDVQVDFVGNWLTVVGVGCDRLCGLFATIPRFHGWFCREKGFLVIMWYMSTM